MDNKKLKKEYLIKYLSVKTGLSLNLSKKIINDLIDIIIVNIKDNNFNLKNFGSFKIRDKKKRIGRNPKTKQEFVIASRKTVSFIPSKKIKEKLNEIII